MNAAPKTVLRRARVHLLSRTHKGYTIALDLVEHNHYRARVRLGASDYISSEMFFAVSPSDARDAACLFVKGVGAGLSMAEGHKDGGRLMLDAAEDIAKELYEKITSRGGA